MRSKRIKVQYSGRQWMLIGGAALAVWSGYELAVRLDDFRAWTAGIRHLSEVRGTPFLEDLWIVFQEPAMGELGRRMLFLLACALLGVFCLIWRNRPRADHVLLALACGVGIFGWTLGVYRPAPGEWMQTLKLVPLLLIIAGCLINITQWHGDRREEKDRRNHPC